MTSLSPVHIDLACAFCDHAERQHCEGDCTGQHPVIAHAKILTTVACRCEHYVNPDDVCNWCEGTGKVDGPTDAMIGMRCRDCAGQGFVAA